VKTMYPLQSPPSAPVALKSTGPADGTFVSPGLAVKVPVGAAGVPPHVQVAAAWAEAAPPVAHTNEAAVAARTPIIARNLICAGPLTSPPFVALLCSTS
jgi:hypothetical protein